MTPPIFLLFYFAKTAKTAEFTGKPRYFEKAQIKVIFDLPIVISGKNGFR